MSHFTVLVIGNDIEEALAPFSEHIEMPRYQSGLVSDEEKERFMNLYRTYDETRTYAQLTEEEAEVNKTLSFDELYDKYGEDWNDNNWSKNADGVWAEYSTYNPKSKWDWYQIGGRWAGFLRKKAPLALGFELEGFSTAEVSNFIEMFQNDHDKFMKVVSKYNGKRLEIVCAIEDMVKTINDEKEPVMGDQFLMKEIDWEGMVADGKKRGEERWAEVMKAFDNDIPKDEIIWGDMFEEGNEHYNLDRDQKLQIYRGQPSQVRLAKVSEENQEVIGFWFDLDEFNCTKEEYIERAGQDAISTFAVLKDGEWYEKGKMGWFACVSDEKDRKEWDDLYNGLLKDVDDDTMITLVDCHI